MRHSLLILVLLPILSFAQNSKLYLAADLSYSTKNTKAGAISTGVIINGFLFGVGIGTQKSEYRSVVPKFVQAGYMKNKKPFVLARMGEASIAGEAYIGGLYLDGKVGFPFQVRKVLRVAPFFSATHYKYRVHHEYSVAPLPNKTFGLGLLISTM